MYNTCIHFIRQLVLINSDCRRQRRSQRETIPYICDFSRGGLNTRLYTLVSKPCSEATNIGYGLSLGAVFGCLCKLKIYFEKNLRETSDSYGLNKFVNTLLLIEKSSDPNYMIMALVQVSIL